MGGRSAREFYLVGKVSGDLTLLVGSMTLASAPGERDQEMLVTASAVFVAPRLAVRAPYRPGKMGSRAHPAAPQP